MTIIAPYLNYYTMIVNIIQVSLIQGFFSCFREKLNKIFIIRPFEGICVNIFPDDSIIFIVANDMVILFHAQTVENL